MKAFLRLLPLLLFIQTAVQAQQVDSVHKEKAKRIIERFTSKDKFPDRIKDQLIGGYHYYHYYSKRNDEKNRVDSVRIEMFVESSKMMLCFREQFPRREDSFFVYDYWIEYGDLSYGLTKHNHIDDKKQTYGGKGTLIYDKNGPYGMDKKTYDDKDPDADRNAIAFYLPKLLYSIDELYDLLFK